MVKENYFLQEKVTFKNILGFYWNIESGLFLELQFNPSSKNRRFFGGGNQPGGDYQLHDYFEGMLKKYKKEDLSQFLTPKKGDTREVFLIPKNAPIF